MFLDSPILGFGFGQFPEAKWPYIDDRSTDLNLEIIRPLSHHNTYLSLLVELGLVGLTLYMLLLASWVAQPGGCMGARITHFGFVLTARSPFARWPLTQFR